MDFAKPGGDELDRWKEPAIQFVELGKVFLHQPEAWCSGIPGENCDTITCDSRALLNAATLVRPVMERQHSHDCVDAVIAEWQPLGPSLNAKVASRGMLSQHHL